MRGKMIIEDDGTLIISTGQGFVAKYTESTIENIMDAARVLSSWVDAKHENQADEIKRIHMREQMQSMVRDAIEEAKRNQRGMP